MEADSSGYAHVTHRQDELSQACLRAICAVTGCGIEKVTLDHDKVDYIVSARIKGSVKSKPKIDIQAKCEMRGIDSRDPIPYSLDVETYNNLRDPLVANPRILVVLFIPKDIAEWASQSNEQLVLRHCAYWVSLKGAAESNNSVGQTVYLPQKNRFTPDALRNMMNQTCEGMDLS
jgi:hypothetical protein